MKVYLLFDGSYPDRTCVGVFSSMGNLHRVVPNIEYGFLVEEHVVDQKTGLRFGVAWTAIVQKSTGQIHVISNGSRIRHPTETTTSELRDTFQATSPISSDHAAEVAKKVWQEWLRTQPVAK